MTKFLCGVIEGFYGRPWSDAQRARLFDWMAAWGMDTYVYAPKDDLKMRAAWRLPYDEVELAELRGLHAQCLERGIAFVYTIAPGLDIRYADPHELQILTDKLAQILQLGVRDFCVLFDDIPFRMAASDEDRFGSFAGAQAHVANALRESVRQRGAAGLFLFCPTDYCGRMARPSVGGSVYLRELGDRLHPDIDVFWTGPEVVSETIPTASMRELQEVLRRKPLIWDNLHANDYDHRRVYLGPYDGREADLRSEVRGILTNPNDEFEANFIPIRSLALYAQRDDYHAHAAYHSLLAEWLPQFATHGREPITLDELALLVDACYLPFTLGERGERVLAVARTLLASETANAVTGTAAAGTDAPAITGGGASASLAGDAGGGGSPGADFAWLQDASRAMNRLFEKLTELDDRDLLHALYPYAWEARHELGYLAAYLRWLEQGRPGGRFGKPEQLPNTYRAGLIAALERLLPVDEAGEMRHRV